MKLSTHLVTQALLLIVQVANAGTVTATTYFTDTLSIDLVNGINGGTVQLQAALNSGPTGTLTIPAGSGCSIQQ